MFLIKACVLLFPVIEIPTFQKPLSVYSCVFPIPYFTTTHSFHSYGFFYSSVLYSVVPNKLLKADASQLLALKQTLLTFSEAIGLFINFEKSIFLPICLEPEQAQSLATILNCHVSSFLQQN